MLFFSFIAQAKQARYSQIQFIALFTIVTMVIRMKNEEPIDFII